jgi:NAD(P)H dehydrogenase (quinone)
MGRAARIARAVAQARAAAVVTSASGGQGLATAAIGDLGEAAATASATMPEKLLWELRGPRWDFDDLAAALTVALGRPIRHEEVSDEEAGPFAVLFPLVRRGVFAVETAELLGWAPATVADVVNRVVSL